MEKKLMDDLVAKSTRASTRSIANLAALAAAPLISISSSAAAAAAPSASASSSSSSVPHVVPQAAAAAAAAPAVPAAVSSGEPPPKASGSRGRASAPKKKIIARALNRNAPPPEEEMNLDELYVPEERAQVMTSDKYAMIVRIFNFYRETNHRFPSPLQDQHDEDLLNRLILQCIGTTCRPSSWNRPSIYLSPYTPIKPSKVHISELDEDCITMLVEQFKSLQDLVAKAFVCPEWVPPVAKVISGRIHSLKVFDFEGNVELYQETALMQYNLARLDLAAGVRQTGDPKEDHIFVRSFRGDENNLVKDIIEALFTKVTYLVLHTLNIDQAGLIRCMDKLSSITLFEPPDSDKQQNAIWEALNAAPELRHVHIFYTNGDFPFEASKMDFLTRIESFTLDNYKPDNLFDILNRLSPELRCLQIGPFMQGDEVLERLIEENPAMVANLTQLSVRLDEKSMEKAQPNELYDECYLMHKKMLNLIVDNFTKLTYLDVEFASLMFFNEVIDRLNKLPKLTELRFASRCNCINAETGFLAWPTQTELIGFPNRRRQPTPLANISKVYLAKNNHYEDKLFFNHMFAEVEDEEDVQRRRIEAEWMRNVREPLPPHIFPGIEQATFVLNANNLSRRWVDFLPSFRDTMRRTVPPEYWLRMRLYNVPLATMNERFFARDEEDVAQSIRDRNAIKAYRNVFRVDRERAAFRRINDALERDMEDDDDNDDDDDDDFDMEDDREIQRAHFRQRNINGRDNDVRDGEDELAEIQGLLRERRAQGLPAFGDQAFDDRIEEIRLRFEARLNAQPNRGRRVPIGRRVIIRPPNRRQRNGQVANRNAPPAPVRQQANRRGANARPAARRQANPRPPRNPRQAPNPRQLNRRPPNNPGNHFRRVNGRLERATD